MQHAEAVGQPMTPVRATTWPSLPSSDGRAGKALSHQFQEEAWGQPRIRDVTYGSSRTQAFYDQYESLLRSGDLELFGRVFHGSPRQYAKVSYGQDSKAPLPTKADSQLMLHLGSYNYSGLNGHPRILEAAAEALRRYGTTTSGVRLLNGTSDLHLQLEQKLARFLGVEDVITYSSGYSANLSALSSLCSPEDVVLSDMLNHQSILDGLKLAGAKVIPFRHRSAKAIEATLKRVPRKQRKFIVTDGIFSMDGDIARLDEIVALAEQYNAFVIVDEAHATAAYGPCGRGTAAHFRLEDEVDVITGSLSKGLPGIGGFVAGPKRTMDVLRFGSNGYIFSASLPPAIVAGLIAALEILMEEPAIQDRLHWNENYLREGIKALGLDVMGSESPIIPILMPDAETTLRFARLLHEDRIYVNAVGYPAVSRRRPRLRLNVSANLEKNDLDRALASISRCAHSLGLSE